MRPMRDFIAGVLILFSLCIGDLLIQPAVNATLLYKNYVIRQDMGRDILCEPYTVRKDDWVYKLFREMGEISQKDFPEFLRIFKQLNPHINNMDIIRPGEQILIPLKRVEKNSMPGQESGVVSIPFVNISNVPELIKSYSNTHEVQKGDYVSKLVARTYGEYGTPAYDEGISLFRYLNPDISNIDLIYPGQRLQIPTISMKTQPWYRFLFDRSGNLIGIKNLEEMDTAPMVLPKTDLADKKREPQDPFAEAASILDGKLLNHGIYYFPQQGKEDVKLDLSRFPLIELKDGARILFTGNEGVQQLDLKVLRSFWKELSIASVSPDADMEQILDVLIESNKNMVTKQRLTFTDQGVVIDIQARWILDRTLPNEKKRRYLCITFVKNSREMTPEPILNYLAQHHITIWDILEEHHEVTESTTTTENPPPEKTTAAPAYLPTSDRRLFVEKLTETLGYRYMLDAPIRYEHNGATVTVECPRVTGSTGKELIIDFGDLGVDVAAGLTKGGYHVVPVKEKYKAAYLIEDMVRALDETYSVNPAFFSAHRAAYHNTRITVSGFLISSATGEKFLLSTSSLHEDIVRFLRQKGLQVVFIQ